MAREKKTVPGAARGNHAKERHKRDRRGNIVDWTAPMPAGLVARPDGPRLSSKHKTWFEFQKNKDKKKKLEYQFTEQHEPPPGFEFVPIGNPSLTTACKELSREQGAMIFIVTSSRGQFSEKLSRHLNRAGHHIRQTIVDQARATLGDDLLLVGGTKPGKPEPIPERQEDINNQADAALRDLFPRIPNTDRQAIIDLSFNKSRLGKKGEAPVGLAADIPLSRRAQLAVLAHIRHTKTRYDLLLKETSYPNARKAVESLCLDYLVKWRGDEETGRDQLDEILCEVIVISDSESDSDDEYESSSASSADEITAEGAVTEGVLSIASLPRAIPSSAPLATDNSRGEVLPRVTHAPRKIQKTSRKDKRTVKWAQRGFSRYQKARDEAWHKALERQRGNDGATQSANSMAEDRFVNQGPQPWRTGEPDRPNPGPAVARSPVRPPDPERRFYGASLPSVEVRYERGSRVNELQQTISPANHYVPQEPRIYGNPPSNGFRPIVGSRPPVQRAPEAERVSCHGQDLKDYLVKSIEPASPELSNFPPRLPIPPRRPESGLAHGAGDSRRVVTHPLGPTAPDMAAAQRFHAACAEEGFARLPPRSDPSRMAVAPGPRLEPYTMVNSQPARTSASTATTGGSNFRYSSTYYDTAASRGGGPILQSGPRPAWIGDDGVILRSASRPIMIQDHPAPFRQPETNQAYVPLERRRSPPNRVTSDARHAGPGWVDGRDGRPIDQRMETLQDDFVEIVRVSNKFPRQHEPRFAPAGVPRYELRSSAPQHSAPPQFSDGGTRYALQQLPAQAQLAEWPDVMARQPGYPQGNGPFVTRQPEGYKSEFQRQERVVGIEYVQARPTLEARTYSDRGLPYDTAQADYRSRSRSVIPVPYSGPTGPVYDPRPHPGRPVPGRNEVITID